MQTHPRTISSAWPREHKPLAGPRIMRSLVIGFGRREQVKSASDDAGHDKDAVAGYAGISLGMFIGTMLLAAVFWAFEKMR